MSLVFFTDRDLGKQVPTVLQKAGLTVERFDDHFAPITPDIEWLRKVGQNGWYVLTHDKKIQYRPHEQEAVMDAGVGLFVLIGKASHDDHVTPPMGRYK